MSKSRTRLEGFLFWWLVSNVVIMVILALLAVVLPSSIVKFTTYGTTSLALALAGLILVVAAWVYLAWRMRAPTVPVLLLGEILFLLGTLRVKWAGGIWALNPVLVIPIRLVSRPSFSVDLDMVALAVFVLFAIAWYRRHAQPDAPANAPLS